MKILKLKHTLAQGVLQGKINSSWSIYDYKDMRVNDDVEVVDIVNPEDKNSWQIIGMAVVTKVLETRLGEVQDVMRGEDGDKGMEELLRVHQREHGEGITLETPVKMIYYDFKPLTKPFLMEQPVQPLEQLRSNYMKLYADGGSRGNPGPSASGYVLYDSSNKIVESTGSYLGVTTNNQAEYQALKLGLDAAKRHGAHEVDVFMDSMLVVNQMKGIFKIKNRDLWPIHNAIKELAGSFRRVHFTHVPRELNREADLAVNRALDDALGIVHEDTNKS